MKQYFLNQSSGGGGTKHRRRHAFSLLEMMVVVAILTVIVLGLFNVFDHTQKALRSNTAQVDVLETGRAAMDLLSRELEGAIAVGQIGTNTNCFHMATTVNYYNVATHDGFTMRLNDGTTRTNVLEDLFFMGRSNNWWTAYGYFVGSVSNNMIDTNVVWKTGVGTLFRSTTQNNPPLMQFHDPDEFFYLVNQITNNHFNITKSSPIAEGVVHFRVRALDSYGQIMGPLKKDAFGNYLKDANDNFVVEYNIPPQVNPIAGEYPMRFVCSQLPAFLEVELGLLPPQVLQRVRAISNADSQRNYLTNQANAVVLFNKVIRLRNAQNER